MDPTARLLEVYRAELDTYREVLDLARRGAECMRQGLPLAHLQDINLEKQRRLDGIRSLERSVAEEKENWRAGARYGAGSAELDAVLSQITAVIEQILDHERETDRWILQGSGLDTPDLASA